MRKRFIALLLCLVMCVTAFTGCATTDDEDDKGAYITMYLTDEVYNFDPAYAFNNDEAESIISMLFIRLFTLDSKGKLKYELADSYTTKDDEKTQEYTMTIKLRETWWSDQTQVTADDIVYAWKRILNPENSFAAAALLYDIKNARAVKEGDCSIDDLGVYALNDTTLEISFERPIDYSQFLLNLTSLALAPLREDYVSKGEDWAKKPSTMVTSGPFKLGNSRINSKDDAVRKYYDTRALLYSKDEKSYYYKESNYEEGIYTGFGLERNAFYFRDPDEDYALDRTVKPYRIYIDCSRTDEEILEAYQNGEIFYIGSIPVSLCMNGEIIKKAEITDALSTAVIYLNEDALVKNVKTGKEVALFADSNVRQALSLALNRTAIAEELVLAEAATALVPTGIFNQGLSGSFRKEGGNLISTSADLTAANNALSKAGIKASDYEFTLYVNPNDDEQTIIAAAAAAAWTELGFNVTVEERGTIINNDYYAPTASEPEDICDELYLENLIYRDYQAIVMDYCAYTADAFSMLAPFAMRFSGIVDSDMNLATHYSGYNSEEYNNLMEAVYYLPYYNDITSADYLSFATYETKEEFQAVLDNCAAVYEKYGVDTSKTAAGRTILMHAAEEMLINDMPVIPVVFNKTATLDSSKLSGVKSTLYTSYYFEKVKLKNYEDYVAEFELIYSATTSYRCSSCGHEMEIDASSTKVSSLPTKCEKCGTALTESDIHGHYPIKLREANRTK